MIRPISIIVAAATVGLFYLHLKPAYADILELRAEEQTVVDTVEQFREASRELDRVRSIYQGIPTRDLVMLDTFLQDKFSPPEFILYIHRIASSYGLTITGFDVSDATAGSEGDTSETTAYVSTTFTFSVEAPYAVFVAFMEDLERSLRPLDITEIAFSAGDTDRYPFKVKLQTYWINK